MLQPAEIELRHSVGPPGASVQHRPATRPTSSGETLRDTRRRRRRVQVCRGRTRPAHRRSPPGRTAATRSRRSPVRRQSAPMRAPRGRSGRDRQQRAARKRDRQHIVQIGDSSTNRRRRLGVGIRRGRRRRRCAETDRQREREQRSSPDWRAGPVDEIHRRGGNGTDRDEALEAGGGKQAGEDAYLAAESNADKDAEHGQGHGHGDIEGDQHVGRQHAQRDAARAGRRAAGTRLPASARTPGRALSASTTATAAVRVASRAGRRHGGRAGRGRPAPGGGISGADGVIAGRRSTPQSPYRASPPWQSQRRRLVER